MPAIVSRTRIDPYRALHRRPDRNVVVSMQGIDQDYVEVAFVRQDFAELSRPDHLLALVRVFTPQCVQIDQHIRRLPDQIQGQLP